MCPQDIFLGACLDTFAKSVRGFGHLQKMQPKLLTTFAVTRHQETLRADGLRHVRPAQDALPVVSYRSELTERMTLVTMPCCVKVERVVLR